MLQSFGFYSVAAAAAEATTTPKPPLTTTEIVTLFFITPSDGGNHRGKMCWYLMQLQVSDRGMVITSVDSDQGEVMFTE